MLVTVLTPDPASVARSCRVWVLRPVLASSLKMGSLAPAGPAAVMFWKLRLVVFTVIWLANSGSTQVWPAPVPLVMAMLAYSSSAAESRSVARAQRPPLLLQKPKVPVPERLGTIHTPFCDALVWPTRSTRAPLARLFTPPRLMSEQFRLVVVEKE